MGEKSHIGSTFAATPKLKFENIDLDPALEAYEAAQLALDDEDLPGASVALPSNNSVPEQGVSELFLLNPTGGADRPRDPFGEGHFGASRDGGIRGHLGHDIVGVAGQDVIAPISGTVSKVGYPYGDDLSFRYVQIEGESGVSARMFYVDPAEEIELGSKVEAGDVIGTLQTLQDRYNGITDHVHLELMVGGEKVDPAPYILGSPEAAPLVNTTSDSKPEPLTP